VILKSSLTLRKSKNLQNLLFSLNISNFLKISANLDGEITL